MKKILLSAMVLFAAMAVNAQEFGTADSETASTLESKTATALPAGTVLHSGTNIIWSTALADSWKSGGSTATYVINNDEGDKDSGVVGSTNPSNFDDSKDTGIASINGSATEIPDTGCVYNFYAKTDGYLYILAKVNTSKCYIVWEEGTRIPYLFACNEPTDGKVISYDLSSVATLNDNGTISDDYEISKVAIYYGNEDLSEDCQAAVIKVAVTSGKTYTFCGTGTKCAVGGYYFDTTGDATITYTDDNYTYTLLEPASDEDEGDVNEPEEDVTPAEGEGVTVSDPVQCWFIGGEPSNTTDFTISSSDPDRSVGYTTGGGHGSVVINGDSIKDCLKIESITQISFTTTVASTVLTLVFDDTDTEPLMYIQEEEGDKSEISSTNNVITYTCEEAGTYTLTRKSGSHYLFYIGLTAPSTGISSAIVSSNVENGAIYNLAGQRLSKLTKGINIVNGKKIFVK